MRSRGGMYSQVHQMDIASATQRYNRASCSKGWLIRPLASGFCRNHSMVENESSPRAAIGASGSGQPGFAWASCSTNWTPLTSMKIWPQAASSHARVNTP